VCLWCSLTIWSRAVRGRYEPVSLVLRGETGVDRGKNDGVPHAEQTSSTGRFGVRVGARPRGVQSEMALAFAPRAAIRCWRQMLDRP